MQRFNETVHDYILQHTSSPSDLLKELERQTHLKILRSQMVSGTLQGKILEMLSCMIKPVNILELGTFTGYSALCLAKGLQPEGKLITIDINDELEVFARSFFNRSPYGNQIDFRIGDAREIIPPIKETFDLVFIDADKRQYPEYYQMVFDKIKPGGYLIADDVLWYGKVNEKIQDNDTYTKGLLAFNNMVQKDNRVENVIFPVRDGLMVVRKLA
ncbi:MAG: methyltransferase [Bacteroidetes bacterium HGW-Bacteroidetes-4]|jgi:predicted O-methyltransferase YrrM|nr:MAG: methyltransferase [Bacteroidetes bacterium HGW-Bacteroidetes-4]